MDKCVCFTSVSNTNVGVTKRLGQGPSSRDVMKLSEFLEEAGSEEWLLDDVLSSEQLDTLQVSRSQKLKRFIFVIIIIIVIHCLQHLLYLHVNYCYCCHVTKLRNLFGFPHRCSNGNAHVFPYPRIVIYVFHIRCH